MYNILLIGKPISNKMHGAEVGVNHALQELGHNVSIFDLGTKAPEENLNTSYDVVLCMGAGIPKKFGKNSPLIKTITNNFSILWNSEPIRLPSYYSEVEAQKGLFDLHATFDFNEIPIYENMGCNTCFLPQAGHPLWYHPIGHASPKKFACFVGRVGGKWQNRVHFLERAQQIIPKEELTITMVFNAEEVNKIYNNHHLVLNLGLYHKELGPPEKLVSYGFQQRIFEAYCAGVPCLTNYPDPIYNHDEHSELFKNHKDIIYYDNSTFDAILKYFYENKNKLIEMRKNIDITKHTYKSRLFDFLEMLKGRYLCKF